MSFDLSTIYHEGRPLSWSGISSFEWNREQWWKKYVGKELPEITPELEFGSRIDKQLQEDPKFLPQITRYRIMQHEMRASFSGIPLIGIADTYGPPKTIPKFGAKGTITTYAALRDYKTGRKAWDQKRADDTGQLTMYCLFLWLIEKIRPEDVELWIDWMPTHYVDKKIEFVEPVTVLSFRTKRTMRDVLKFGQRIMDTYSAMEEYAARRPVLDTHDYAEFMR